MKGLRFTLITLAAVAGCHHERPAPSLSAADIPDLIQDLKTGDERDRADAAQALGQLGPDAKPALPALLLALRDEGEWVRERALEAILAIGPDPRAVESLVTGLKDSDEQVRELSAKALGKIGTAARKSIPALREATRDRQERVQKAAADALLQIDPHSPAQ
jgi:HEAT repeat protein